MKSNALGVWLLAAVTLGLAGAGLAEEPLRSREPVPRKADFEGVAVLEIKSNTGVCYWTIAGDGDLVRFPVKDESFESILVSARFDADELHVTLAGERSPLETAALGQYELGLKDGAPTKVSPFRNRGTESRDWVLRVVPPTEKVDTSNCCSCGLAKLKCCPAPNYCMGCGVCGDCCG